MNSDILLCYASFAVSFFPILSSFAIDSFFLHYSFFLVLILSSCNNGMCSLQLSILQRFFYLFFCLERANELCSPTMPFSGIQSVFA